MSENNQKGMFVLYEWIETTSELTDEQFGQLIRGLFLYNTENKTTQFNDPTTKMAFCFIKQSVDRLNDNYLKKKNAGSHGGAPKGNKNASKKNKQNKQKQAETTENNLPIPIPIPIPIPNPKPIPLSGEGDTPAPAREEFLETFGILGNVKMKAAEYRHLVEDYGQQATDDTIDDLSCKLADGSVDSSNHHATVLGWLRYQRRNGGPVPMSSKTVSPEAEHERKVRELKQLWDAMSEEDKRITIELEGMPMYENPKYIERQ